jgi:acyl carrier protein
MELADELRQALIEELRLEDVKPDRIQADTVLFGPQGLGLDSIDALELVVVLRRRFKVDITDRAAGEKAFKSFGALVEFVRAQKSPSG